MRYLCVMRQYADEATICALSTAPGMGAIAVVRVSGKDAISISNDVFSRDLMKATSHKALLGSIMRDGVEIDEALAIVFQGPRSYTGEDVVEFNCHGSTFIQQSVLDLLISKGCRMAMPGEFSLRGFMKGKMDLTQAEAVADLIASESAASHALAMNQMRGGFSKEIAKLREELINFASLIELELDFSEEDVEFADRRQFEELIGKLLKMINTLIGSFKTGNVIKNGVPVAILGAPNRGKSTLLNSLLNEERAIVSSIAGTTRDTVEETMVIEGIQFRFIDTAGIRNTTDEIESQGIERAIAKAKKASILCYLVEGNSVEEWKTELQSLRSHLEDSDIPVILILNKLDLLSRWEDAQAGLDALVNQTDWVNSGLLISALQGQNIDALKKEIYRQAEINQESGNQAIVSNVRHLEALRSAKENLEAVLNGLQIGISGDFLAMDVRHSLHHLGEITGEITTDDLLGNIFGKFCIGK